MKFAERYPIEEGFAPIFQAEVRPNLMALEAQRVDRLGKAKRYVSIALATMVVIWAAIYMIWGFSDGALFGFFFVGIIGAIGALGSWAVQSTGWNTSVADAVMPAICAHVGEVTFDADGGNAFPVGDMLSLGLLPSYNSSDRSNRLDGLHRGTAYEMMELQLKRKSRDSKGRTKTSTVFRGLVFHITVPIEAPCDIVILRDMGGVGNWFGEKLSFGGVRSRPQVQFANPEFEEVFEVYAENPERAAAFMPPAFLDNLLAIGEEEGGRKGAKAMVAGFRGSTFYLALRRGGAFMQMGKLTTPVADMEENLHEIFHDIELSHRIIDRLHGV